MSDLLTLARNLRPYLEEAAQSLSDADGLKAAALYVRVDESHAGTLADPIPAARSMEYVYGRCYSDPEDGKVYLCTRTGEADGGTITLHYLPHELVGLYFQEVTA